MPTKSKNELEYAVIGSFAALAIYVSASTVVLPPLPVLTSVAMFGSGLGIWIYRKSQI